MNSRKALKKHYPDNQDKKTNFFVYGWLNKIFITMIPLFD